MALLDTEANGYTTLPAGKIAAAVVYLEQRTRPEPRPEPALDGLALERMGGADVERYLALFAAVGEPWLWFGRRVMPREALVAILADPAVEALALVRDGRDIGLVEIDARDPRDIELAYFGLVPEAVGGGTGRWSMNRAIERAWARAPQRFFVHTCNFDHPDALGFYVRSGFVPYGRAIEIADDPRLLGFLPRSAGPHVPLIEP